MSKLCVRRTNDCQLTLSRSPRWLIKRNKYGDAYVALRELRETPLQAARDLYYIHVQLQVETSLFARDRRGGNEIDLGAVIESDMYQAEVESTSYWTRVVQLFSIARNRRASLAAFIVMISQ